MSTSIDEGTDSAADVDTAVDAVAGAVRSGDAAWSLGDELAVFAVREVVAEVQAIGTLSSDAARIDTIALAEAARRSLTALIARVSTAFADSQIAAQRAAGVRARDLGRGVAEQLALARNVTPTVAGLDLGFARQLRDRYPRLARRLHHGDLSELAVRAVIRECRHLTDELARHADDLLADDLDPSMSLRNIEAAARRHAIELDQPGYLARLAKAPDDRYLSCRPKPDGMTQLTALVPISDGVHAWACIDRAARSLKATGDERTLDQLRADIFVEYITGLRPGHIDHVVVNVTMPLDSLLGDTSRRNPDDSQRADDVAANIDGYGPIPAATIRDLIARGNDTDSGLDTDDADSCQVWLRRLFTDPIDDSVVAADPRRRLFPPAMQRFIRARDQHCRMPGCDAPIRHADHVTPFAETADTSIVNSEGACESWNYVKQIPGWRVTVEPAPAGRPGANRSLTITTPTGHTYTSHTPPALGYATHTSRPPPRAP